MLAVRAATPLVSVLRLQHPDLISNGEVAQGHCWEDRLATELHCRKCPGCIARKTNCQHSTVHSAYKNGNTIVHADRM